MRLETVKEAGYEHDGDRIVGDDGSVFEYACTDEGWHCFVKPEAGGSLLPEFDVNGAVSTDRSIVAIEIFGDGTEFVLSDGPVAANLYNEACQDALGGFLILKSDACSSKFADEIHSCRINRSAFWQEYEENTLFNRDLSANEVLVLGVLRGEGFRYLHDGDGSIIFKPEALYRTLDGDGRDFTDIYPEFRISYSLNDAPDTWIARVKKAIEDCTDRVYRNFIDAGYPNPYGISPDAPEFKELDALYAQIGHTLDEQIITLPKKVEEAFLKQASGLPSDTDPYGDCDEYSHKPSDSGTEPDRDWSRTHWVRHSSTESEPDVLETSESNPWEQLHPNRDEGQRSLDDDDFPGYVIPEPWIPNFEPWNPDFGPQR